MTSLLVMCWTAPAGRADVSYISVAAHGSSATASLEALCCSSAEYWTRLAWEAS